jgi:hypothetical protein
MSFQHLEPTGRSSLVMSCNRNAIKIGKEQNMLVGIFVILLILWILGVITGYTFGGLVHLLLVIGVIVLLLSLAEGRGRRGPFRFSTSPGLLLAGLWFILTGLLSLFGFRFQGEGTVMAILALIAGIVLVIGR